MNKLSIKIFIAGWVIFAINSLIEGALHSHISGIVTGMFIASAWIAVYEYKNQ